MKGLKHYTLISEKEDNSVGVLFRFSACIFTVQLALAGYTSNSRLPIQQFYLSHSVAAILVGFSSKFSLNEIREFRCIFDEIFDLIFAKIFHFISRKVENFDRVSRISRTKFNENFCENKRKFSLGERNFRERN